MCVGKNYLDHVAEVAAVRQGEVSEAPKYPVLFTKAPSTVIGPDDPIPSHHKLTKWLDYEAELAVVLGSSGVDIEPENAMSHVFGYTIGNDVTARELQKRHGQWFKGKSLDGTCPLGPVLVPASEIGDPESLSIGCRVNDQVRQASNTANMIFKIPEIISVLSKGMTLFPGDIILTGTPDGVGFAMDPPQVLKSGDKVEVEIEKLGILRNHVV